VFDSLYDSKGFSLADRPILFGCSKGTAIIRDDVFFVVVATLAENVADGGGGCISLQDELFSKVWEC
jgi:hypothetical protein